MVVQDNPDHFLPRVQHSKLQILPIKEEVVLTRDFLFNKVILDIREDQIKVEITIHKYLMQLIVLL